jgi:hypothetical protein
MVKGISVSKILKKKAGGKEFTLVTSADQNQLEHSCI